MDPQSYNSHYYHHGAQDMHGVNDINQISSDHSMINHYYNYPPPYEERLMYHQHQQQQQHHHNHHHQQQQHHHQQQQQQQYNDVMMVSLPMDNGHIFDPPQSQPQPQHIPIPQHSSPQPQVQVQAQPQPQVPTSLPQTNPPQYPLHPHNKKEPPSQGVTYTCSETGCNFSANHKNSLTAHLKTHGIETPRRVQSDPSSPVVAQIHQCSECDRRYKSQGGLYWHSQTVHKKRVFNCTLCSKVYKSYPGFYLHRKTHEDGGSTERKKRTIKNHVKTLPLNDDEPAAAATATAVGGNEDVKMLCTSK